MLSEIQVKDILGESLFEDCLSFFEEMYNRESEYKVILTRRCFSLYKIFAPILKQRGIVNVHGTILTDNAIALYMDKIEHVLTSPPVPGTASVIIIDDIIIYGRTVSGLLNRLLEKGDRENIRVLCLFRNTKSLVPTEYSDLILSRYGASSLEWKRYSCAFSKLIKCADIANTSYIVSACFSPSLSSSSDIAAHMLRVTPGELQEYNIESYVEAVEMSTVFCGLANPIPGFVRMYLYKGLNSVLISPLLILNDLSRDDMRAISDKLIELGFDNQLNSLLTSNDERLFSCKLRLISLLLSHMLLRDFLLKNSLWAEMNNFDYEEIIRYNFSEEFIAPFECFDSNICKLNANYFSYTTDGIAMNCPELEDFVFTKAMEDNKSAVHNSVQRQLGFSMFGNECLYTKKYFGCLMTMIDNGLAALRIKFQKNHGCGVTLACPGEQAFRIMNNKYPNLLPALYALENIAFVYSVDSYTLYSGFCTLVRTEGLLNDSEYDSITKYVDILKTNGQQISDVTFIDESKQDPEVYARIMKLLNSFKGDIIKS